MQEGRIDIPVSEEVLWGKSVPSYIVSLVVRGLVEGAELGTLGLGKEKEGPGK